MERIPVYRSIVVMGLKKQTKRLNVLMSLVKKEGKIRQRVFKLFHLWESDNLILLGLLT